MNLREVRKKIKSVGNVKKITKAMQLVSSVKMKKAQRVALEGKPYRDNLEKMIARLTGFTEIKQSKLIKHDGKTKGKDLIIVISSNKGLAGSFVTSLERYIIRKTEYKKHDFLSVGKKGSMFLGIIKAHILADFSSNKPALETPAIFKMAYDAFEKHDYDNVYLMYNKFISTLRFETVFEKILPVNPAELIDDVDAKREPVYTVEPEGREMIDALLHSYVEEKVRGAILNSEASEHSARMIAMKNATDNAGDVIYSLRLEGNKLRQAKITSELLDMITAKESVES